MNEVKNVLLLLLRQEAIHGDQIGLLVLQRRTVAGPVSYTHLLSDAAELEALGAGP